MSINSLTKLSLSVVGATGVSSAVGIPVALHIQKNSQEGSKNSYNNSSFQISMSKCDAQSHKNGETIDFGNPIFGNLCWDFKTNGRTVENPEQYTTLFQDQWKNKDKDWNKSTNNGQWTQQCLKSSSEPWIIINSEDWRQYLGLCASSSPNKTLFVKKRKEPAPLPNKEKWTFLVCDNNCWENEAYLERNNQKTLKQEKQDNWKEIEFYKTSMKK